MTPTSPRSRNSATGAARLIASSAALLVAAGGLAVSAQPAGADHPATAVEAAAATDLTPDEFLDLFDNADLPGLGEIGPAPAITGNAALDARIRAVGELRGYKRRPLPDRALTQIDGRLLQPEAAQAWQALRAAAKEAGLTITLRSAFRNEAHQAGLYRRKAGTSASDAAIDRVLDVVAVPGYSRHHTGYAVDLADADGDHNTFGSTRAYAWLAADNYANAKAHGWIPSYPDGTRAAGPDPEPWEFVWVGHTNIICADFVPTAGHRFCDTHWSEFSEDVDWLAAQGITTGCEPVRFCVDGDLTRAQAATLLWRYSGRPETEADLPFTDVAPDSYYSQSAQWLFARGLTTGTSATSFDPHRPISRAELLTFLWRMAARPEPAARVPPFDDVAPQSFAAKPAAWAAETGITAPAAGDPQDQHGARPHLGAAETVTRQQAAAFIHRFAEYQNQSEQPGPDADAPDTPDV